MPEQPHLKRKTQNHVISLFADKAWPGCLLGGCTVREKTRALKQAIMQELLTGRTRLL